MLNAFSESVCRDGLEEQVYCSHSSALGIILGTYLMCLMSLCSCTKIIGGNHTPTFAIQVGPELLIAYLVGDGGGRGDGDLLAPTVLHPWGEGNKRCVILGGVMLCGVTWAANSCFKAYIGLLIRNWSSHCPLSRGNSQGFHVLSFINSLIWEGDMLPLRRCEQSFSLRIHIPGGTRFSFPAPQHPERQAQTQRPCLLPLTVRASLAGRSHS